MEKEKGGLEATTPSRVLREEEALAAAFLQPRPLESRLDLDQEIADERAEPGRGASRTTASSGRLLRPLGQEHRDRNVAQAFRLVVSGGSGEEPDAVRSFRLEGHAKPDGAARD